VFGGYWNHPTGAHSCSEFESLPRSIKIRTMSKTEFILFASFVSILVIGTIVGIVFAITHHYKLSTLFSMVVNLAWGSALLYWAYDLYKTSNLKKYDTE
jgi:hypothetical protein